MLRDCSWVHRMGKGRQVKCMLRSGHPDQHSSPWRPFGRFSGRDWILPGSQAPVNFNGDTIRASQDRSYPDRYTP